MNNIYRFVTGFCGYDVYDGAVVIAKNRAEAWRVLEKADITFPYPPNIKQIGKSKRKPCIVLTSFNAG
jgi:hypothetical protein